MNPPLWFALYFVLPYELTFWVMEILLKHWEKRDE